ncbi:MAG TPA: hypothetical protein QGF41_00355 [Gammaproteobacteria bacterium]|nr:hypothetical protein [Gammaproteobacteria bacterium]
MLDRFGRGEIDLFIKHGMTSVGDWIPGDDKLSPNTLVYMVGPKLGQIRYRATYGQLLLTTNFVWFN